MRVIANVVYFAFNLYALGLLAWVVLSWFHRPDLLRLRARMDRFYAPPVEAIRTRLKRLNIGVRGFDLSPAILLIGILVIRRLVVSLLVGF